MLNALLLEFGFLIFLGILYYFYQKRKLLEFEKNKIPNLLGWLLQSALSERGTEVNTELDLLITQIDDYLKNQSTYIPTKEISLYLNNPKCSKEFKIILEEILNELNGTEKK